MEKTRMIPIKCSKFHQEEVAKTSGVIALLSLLISSAFYRPIVWFKGISTKAS
jgi:hypothetical protein